MENDMVDLNAETDAQLVDRLVQCAEEEDLLYVEICLRRLLARGVVDAVVRQHSWKGVSPLILVATSPYTKARELILQVLLFRLDTSIHSAFVGVDLETWARGVVVRWENKGKRTADQAQAVVSCKDEAMVADWIDAAVRADVLPTLSNFSVLTGCRPLPPPPRFSIRKPSQPQHVPNTSSVPEQPAPLRPVGFTGATDRPTAIPSVGGLRIVRVSPTSAASLTHAIHNTSSLHGLEQMKQEGDAVFLTFSTPEDAAKAVGCLEGGFDILSAELVLETQISAAGPAIQTLSVTPEDASPSSPFLNDHPIRIRLAGLPGSISTAEVVALFVWAEVRISRLRLVPMRGGAATDAYATVPDRSSWQVARTRLDKLVWGNSYLELDRDRPDFGASPEQKAMHPTVFVDGLPPFVNQHAVLSIGRTAKVGVYGAESVLAMRDGSLVARGSFRTSSPAAAAEAVRQLDGTTLPDGRRVVSWWEPAPSAPPAPLPAPTARTIPVPAMFAMTATSPVEGHDGEAPMDFGSSQEEEDPKPPSPSPAYQPSPSPPSAPSSPLSPTTLKSLPGEPASRAWDPSAAAADVPPTLTSSLPEPSPPRLSPPPSSTTAEAASNPFAGIFASPSAGSPHLLPQSPVKADSALPPISSPPRPPLLGSSPRRPSAMKRDSSALGEGGGEGGVEGGKKKQKRKVSFAD
ncbi:hypothetical protein JCM6882_000613 [Rhodosporidiobolus microsporus]